MLLLIPVFAVCGLFAQAPIDPALPEAPLKQERALFMTGYEVVPPGKTAVPPLSAKQKLQIAIHQTVDPSILLKGAIPTGFDEAAGTGPDYGSGWAAAGKLYAYNTANIAANYLFANSLIPIAFHQDPRYFVKGYGPIKSRILYALRSDVVAYSNRGTSMPNYGMIVGLGMSSALSNAYLPAKEISFQNTMKSYVIRLGVTAGFRVFSEFGGFRGLVDRRQKH